MPSDWLGFTFFSLMINRVKEGSEGVDTSIVISSFSLILSLCALLYYQWSSQIHAGQIEIELRSIIVQARQEYVDFCLKRLQLVGNQKALDDLERIVLENYFNVYNEACNKYLEQKIDKRFFASTYTFDIKSAFDLLSEQEKVHYAFKEEFLYLRQVYAEWFEVK
jgi:hypothetical protein